MYTAIAINNPQIRNILLSGQNKDFGKDESRAKGFDDINKWHHYRDWATSDNYLDEYLQRKDCPNIKHKLNFVFGETEAGSYIIDNLKILLKFDKFYTSGYRPFGFVGWHTDSFSPGFVIGFIYSPSGDGWTKFKDENFQTQMIQDVPGWNCVAMDVFDASWHCASADAQRYFIGLHYADEINWQKSLAIIDKK